MNYAQFKDDIRAFGSRLFEHGVPNDAIEDILNFAEQTAIIAEAKAKNDRQYEMQLRQHGAAEMGRRLGISRQAARKRFNRIISQPKRPLAVAL